jgi:hypothetical protein
MSMTVRFHDRRPSHRRRAGDRRLAGICTVPTETVTAARSGQDDRRNLGQRSGDITGIALARIELDGIQ